MLRYLPRLMARTSRNARNALASGFRDGVFDVLKGGKYSAAPPMIRKGIGSMDTDRRARNRDMGRFRSDVEKHRSAIVDS